MEVEVVVPIATVLRRRLFMDGFLFFFFIYFKCSFSFDNAKEKKIGEIREKHKQQQQKQQIKKMKRQISSIHLIRVIIYIYLKLGELPVLMIMVIFFFFSVVCNFPRINEAATITIREIHIGSEVIQKIASHTRGWWQAVPDHSDCCPQRVTTAASLPRACESSAYQGTD